MADVKSIITREGIKVDGIPMDWPDDDQRIKDRVAIERRRRQRAGVPDGTVTQVTAATLQGSEILRGLEGGLQNVAMQAGNVLGLVPDERLVEAEEQRALEPKSLGAKVGSFGGELVGSSAIGGPLVSAARRVLGLAPPIARAMESVSPVVAGAGRGMGEGAIEGALLAGPGERAQGAAIGGVLGGATGAVIPGVVEGPVTPTESARRLLDMGVDLSPGQLNSQGTLNLLEQLSESVPLAAGVTTARREKAQEDFAHAMANLARAPGAPEVSPGHIADMTKAVRKTFKPAYAIAHGFPVKPGWNVPLEKSLEYVARHPAHFASKKEANMAKNFVNAELSRYKKRLLVRSEDLLTIRSNVRDQIADLVGRGERAPAGAISILESFEDKITRALEDQLPPEIMPAIKEVDRQYAKYKIVQEASAKTMSGTHPTPSGWVRAAQRRADQRQKAENDFLMAPEVLAGREVFETTLPRTGARAATLQALGIGGTYGVSPLLTAAIFGPVAAAAQFPAGRRALTGQTGPQQLLQNVGQMTPRPVTSTLGTVTRASPVVYSQQPEY